MPGISYQFHPADGVDASPVRKWAPPIAGLASAFIVSSLVCGQPRGYWASLDALIVSAFSCVLTTFLVCALTVWLTGVLLPDSSGTRLGSLTWRVASAAAWFAPLAVFLEQESLLGMAAAAVLAGALTMGLCAYPQQVSSGEMPNSPGQPSANGILSLWDEGPLLRQLFPALAISFLGEGAALAAVTSKVWLAVLLTGGLAALLVWLLNKRVLQYVRPLSRDGPNKYLLVTMAVVFTVLALGPYLRFGRGKGTGTSEAQNPAAEKQWRVLQEASEYPVGYSAEGDPSADGEDLYPGIILWPERQPSTKLITPMPVAINASLRQGRRSAPLTIPFDGVYWFSRWPEKHPTKRAHVAHGSPEEYNIRSVGDRPLVSQARQNLGSLINLNCCSEIQVAIENADRYPGSVSLELILQNTALPGKPSLSLGMLRVPSAPSQNPKAGKPVYETLTFSVPAKPAIDHFDEVTVLFGLRGDRSLVAARMRIERFVLIPRGM